MARIIDRRRFVHGLGTMSAAFAAACKSLGPGAQVKDGAPSQGGGDPDTFDYVIVGSGAGGGPLACNLARAGFRVCLIEAGQDRSGQLDYQVPAFHPRSTEDDAISWDFYVKHYDHDPNDGKLNRNGLDSKFNAKYQGIWYPRAGTLGGCTAHNAMIMVYPHASDWEYIRELTGDSSWSADNMRGYFQVMENCGYLKDDEAAKNRHGTRSGGGWLATNRASPTDAVTDLKIVSFLAAAAHAFSKEAATTFFTRIKKKTSELVALISRDLNRWTPDRDGTEGLYLVPMAVNANTGKRSGVADYINATKGRFPLEVRTGCLATEVLFDPAVEGQPLKAVGVAYRQGANLYRAHTYPNEQEQGVARKVFATREVIVSGGTFNTPQLLMLSGIGPDDVLSQHGIKTKINLKGVGRNLQDRYEICVVNKMTSDFSIIKDCTWGEDKKNWFAYGEDPCLKQWKKNEGPYKTNGVIAAVIKRSSSAVNKDPDLFVFAAPLFFAGYQKAYSRKALQDKRHWTWAILKGHTENRGGYVRIRSADPRDTPEINFRYFEDGDTDKGQDKRDMQAMVEGVKFVRGIMNNKEAKTLVAGLDSSVYEEVLPGTDYSSDERIEEWVRKEAWGHHASCTCPIGKDGDEMAVLDGNFKVRGTANLRVVDASVFPRIPGFFIVSAVMMISEKATDVILQAAGKKPRVQTT